MRDWFADPGNAAIALAALVVSIVALVVSVRTSRRQTAIMEAQEHDRQRAARRAQLRASWAFSHDIGACFYVHIWNMGASTARNIDVLVDGNAARSWEGESLELLAPAAEYVLPVGGTSAPRRVRLTWQDDSGEPGEWESQL